MSLPTPDCPLESRTTSTEDPFISPEYHLRNRSLSSASHVSATSSTADFCSNASTFRRRRSVWHWPLSDLRLQSLRLRAIPLRWLAVFLCLVATLVVWRLPPPSTEKYTFHVDQLSSSSTPWVLRPHDSGKSSAIDPERWLRENSEEALAKKRRWWTRPPPKPRAAIISLVRNEELEGIMQSMRQLEYHWNGRYNYPWVFFNEKPFTEEFKAATSNLTSAQTYYELIPTEHWSTPDWVDEDRYMNSLEYLGTIGVGKGWMLSYRNMCRWNSGFFYKHPRLKDFDYYWRVEPDVHFFCTIPYDPFAFMSSNSLVYGFNMNILDDARSFPSLWPQTLSFISSFPHLLHPRADLSWLVDPTTGEYNNCQFFSNFEIGDLNFFRAEANDKYFEYLDQGGGFYYERFGDAPIHTLSVAMFAPREKVWFFQDIGYQHDINRHCPSEGVVGEEGGGGGRCACEPTGLDENFYKLVPLESPQVKPMDTCIRGWLAAGKGQGSGKGKDWLKKKEGWDQETERAFGGDGYSGYVVQG